MLELEGIDEVKEEQCVEWHRGLKLQRVEEVKCKKNCMLELQGIDEVKEEQCVEVATRAQEATESQGKTTEVEVLACSIEAAPQPPLVLYNRCRFQHPLAMQGGGPLPT